MAKIKEVENKSCNGQPHGQSHTTQVTINGDTVEIEIGKYLVSDLKVILSVPVEYELEHVKHGEFTPLSDDSCVMVNRNEEFVSHVMSGASS